MIDSRRWPKPSPPSTNWPSSSGPRCAKKSVIAFTMTGEAGWPSKFRYPAIPHTALALAFPCDDGDTCLLDDLALDIEAGIVAPFPHFLLGLAVRIDRCKPVEIYMRHLVEREIGPVEHLDYIPVEKALNVVFARLDTEQLHVIGDGDLCIELAKGDAEFGKWLHCLPGLLGRETLQFLADVV